MNHDLAIDDDEHGIARILFADDGSAGWKAVFFYDVRRRT